MKTAISLVKLVSELSRRLPRITLVLLIPLLLLGRSLSAQQPAAVPQPTLKLALETDAQFKRAGNIQVSGPHRFLRVGGKTGYQPLSLKSSLRIATDIHCQNQGSILLSVCPLETLAVAAGMESYLSKDPYAQVYTLLSDALPANDLSKSVFAWWWTSRWHPQMLAIFGPRRADFTLSPCVLVEHLPLREKTWYQLAFTWNKSDHRLRLYVNGILCGTTDYPFSPQAPRPELFLGNTAMAFADLQFFAQELSAAQVRESLAHTGFSPDKTVSDELLALFTVQPGSRLDWLPDPTWKLSYQASFTRPADLAGWTQQGCTTDPYKMKALEITPEGLLMETPDLIHNETRMYLWSPDNFEGDIAVQYDFRPEKDSGLALLVVHASGMQREDFILDHPPRTSGAMTTIIADRVRNYHWEYFRRTGDVRADLGTQVLVKNPWARPLGMATLPRLQVGAWHRLLFVREGAHLRAALDGQSVFDVTDSPLNNTGPVFNYGRVGLRLMYQTRIRFRDLNIWTRNPGVEIVR